MKLGHSCRLYFLCMHGLLDGTRMERIGQIKTDNICENPSDPFHPCPIHDTTAARKREYDPRA